MAHIGYKEEKFTKDAVFSSATLQYASKVLAGKYFLSSGAKIFMIPADKTDEDKYDIADGRHIYRKHSTFKY